MKKRRREKRDLKYLNKRRYYDIMIKYMVERRRVVKKIGKLD